MIQNFSKEHWQEIIRQYRLAYPSFGGLGYQWRPHGTCEIFWLLGFQTRPPHYNSFFKNVIYSFCLLFPSILIFGVTVPLLDDWLAPYFDFTKKDTSRMDPSNIEGFLLCFAVAAFIAILEGYAIERSKKRTNIVPWETLVEKARSGHGQPPFLSSGVE